METKNRNTFQCMKILEYLKSVKTHPTADTIFENVVKEIPTISKGTIYRNLNKLADNNQILRLEINGEYHFDADLCHHQHCVCKSCGKIFDLFQENISSYALKQFKSNDFTPKCVSIIFSGLCKHCS